MLVVAGIHDLIRWHTMDALERMQYKFLRYHVKLNLGGKVYLNWARYSYWLRYCVVKMWNISKDPS